MSRDGKRASPGGLQYTEFVAGCWDRQLRVAALLAGDRHRGEDLLQDCLVKLYVRWRRVAARGDPEAYLRRMLVNANVSRWRRHRREELVAEAPDRAGPTGAADEGDERLRAALRALPDRQRAVVVLRHYDDLTVPQIAAALGCGVGTVKTHHARAMARLRAALLDPAHQLDPTPGGRT